MAKSHNHAKKIFAKKSGNIASPEVTQTGNRLSHGLLSASCLDFRAAVAQFSTLGSEVSMIDTIVNWLGGEAKTVAFAILSGVVAFLAKGFYDLWLARRKDKLERINQQLKLLYGPLYALNQAGNLAWLAFRKRTRPGGPFFDSLPPPTMEELQEWRRWMTTVFKPVHEEMLSVIVKNADLLIEDDFPQCLRLFCAHASAYKVVFERWSKNDFAEHTSVMNYPGQEMEKYLEKSFRRLKMEQSRLLNVSVA